MTKEEKLLKEIERIEAMYREQALIAGDLRYVFGIDEAGRGPLCGPVAAACCIFESDARILYINDSKKLSETKREALYTEITDKALAYGIGLADEKRIDEINILNATFEAMTEAFDKCMEMLREKLAKGAGELRRDSYIEAVDRIPGISDSVVLVDGNKTVPGIRFKQKAVIKGDARCPSMSAASILAKVTRDRLLKEYDRLYPEYGFSKNKGYGTKEHIEAIKKYGPLDIHRKTFIRNFIKQTRGDNE